MSNRPLLKWVKLFGTEFELDKFYRYESSSVSEIGKRNIFSTVTQWRLAAAKNEAPHVRREIERTEHRKSWETYATLPFYGDTVVIQRNGKPSSVRFTKGFETWLRETYQYKMTDENKLWLGNMLNASKAAPCWFKLVNQFNWIAGDFGDKGSCFWDGRENAKNVLQHNGGLAIQIFNEDKVTGLGRAWIIPHHKQHSDIVMLFNGYGGYGGLEEISHILCDFLVQETRQHLQLNRVSLKVNGDTSGLVYINSGAGRAIAKAETKVASEYNYKMPSSWAECFNCHEDVDGDECCRTNDGKTFCENCIDDSGYVWVAGLNRYARKELVQIHHVGGIRITDDFATEPQYEISTFFLRNPQEVPDNVFYCNWSDSYWAKSIALIVNGKFTSPEAIAVTRICRSCYQRYFIEESFNNSEHICDNCYGTRHMPPQMSTERVFEAFLVGKAARTRHNTLFTDGITLWTSYAGIDVPIAAFRSQSYRVSRMPDRFLDTIWYLSNTSGFPDRVKNLIDESPMERLTGQVNHIQRQTVYFSNHNSFRTSTTRYSTVTHEYYFFASENYLAIMNGALMKSERDSFRASRKLLNQLVPEGD